eukprot:1079513-Pyramimonas_sp.AAC.1
MEACILDPPHDFYCLEGKLHTVSNLAKCATKSVQQVDMQSAVPLYSKVYLHLLSERGGVRRVLATRLAVLPQVCSTSLGWSAPFDGYWQGVDGAEQPRPPRVIGGPFTRQLALGPPVQQAPPRQQRARGDVPEARKGRRPHLQIRGPGPSILSPGSEFAGGGN